jgi:hypothetical protein
MVGEPTCATGKSLKAEGSPLIAILAKSSPQPSTDSTCVLPSLPMKKPRDKMVHATKLWRTGDPYLDLEEKCGG